MRVSFFFFAFFLIVNLECDRNWFYVSARGCIVVVVRVWKKLDEPPVEICGEKLQVENEIFMSESNAMRIT